MVPTESYRVTRDGKNVFVGDQESLIQQARDGHLMAKDLVYDPESGKWSFARSVRILSGIDLGGSSKTRSKTRTNLRLNMDELMLRRSQRQRQNMVRSMLVVLLAMATIAAVLMVPTERKREQRSLFDFVDQVAEESLALHFPRDDLAKGDEGLGSSASEGVAMGVAQKQQGTDGGGGADPSAQDGVLILNGLAQTGKPIGGSQGESAVEIILGVRRTAEEESPSGTLKGQLLPNAPGHLLVLVEDTGAGGAEGGGSGHALRILGEAMRSFAQLQGNTGAEPDGHRMREILAARYRATVARDIMGAIKPPHSELSTANTLVDDLSKEFEKICTPLEGKAFCEVKLEHPHWPDAVVHMIEGGDAAVGMTHAQVRAAWGGASRIQRDGEARRYCFDSLCGKSVVFVGDVVVAVDQ